MVICWEQNDSSQKLPEKEALSHLDNRHRLNRTHVAIPGLLPQ